MSHIYLYKEVNYCYDFRVAKQEIQECLFVLHNANNKYFDHMVAIDITCLCLFFPLGLFNIAL